jgi:hypothetical protein
MQKLKYLGVPIYMNGQNYYIPSLTMSEMRANYDLLTTSPEDGASPFAFFDAFLPVILRGINRNYPEVTKEQLEEWLDLTTLRLAARAVQSASGLTPVSEGE